MLEWGPESPSCGPAASTHVPLAGKPSGSAARSPPPRYCRGAARSPWGTREGRIRPEGCPASRFPSGGRGPFKRLAHAPGGRAGRKRADVRAPGPRPGRACARVVRGDAAWGFPRLRAGAAAPIPMAGGV